MSFKDTMLKFAANVSEHSPQIKIVAGVIGLIGAGVWACIESTKLKEKTKEERQTFDDIHKVKMSQNDELPKEEKISDDITIMYTEKDYAKDVIRTSVSFAKKLVLTYGLPIALAILSAGLIFNGTNVLCVRNAAISAAYTTLSNAFETYRERVKERYGEDVENEIHYGVEYQDVDEVVIDEDGNTKTVKNKLPVLKEDPSLTSPYTVLFNDSCNEHTKNIDYDEVYLSCIQKMFTDMLDKKVPFMTFNDLLNEIGKDRKEEDKTYQRMSMCCGWTHGDKVDLRIQRVFIMGEDGKTTPYCMIDPNVRDIYEELISENNYINENCTV